jgi:hypothetical protein
MSINPFAVNNDEDDDDNNNNSNNNIQQNSCNLTSDNSDILIIQHFLKTCPKARNFASYQKRKASLMSQADHIILHRIIYFHSMDPYSITKSTLIWK